MFDPERLLGQMLGGALGGGFGNDRGRRSSGFMGAGTAAKAQLGIGLLGIAMAAYEHYSQNKTATPVASGSASGFGSASPSAAQPAAMPPPPPMSHAAALPS